VSVQPGAVQSDPEGPIAFRGLERFQPVVIPFAWAYGQTLRYVIVTCEINGTIGLLLTVSMSDVLIICMSTCGSHKSARRPTYVLTVKNVEISATEKGDRSR